MIAYIVWWLKILRRVMSAPTQVLLDARQAEPTVVAILRYRQPHDRSRMASRTSTLRFGWSRGFLHGTSYSWWRIRLGPDSEGVGNAKVWGGTVPYEQIAILYVSERTARRLIQSRSERSYWVRYRLGARQAGEIAGCEHR